MGVNMFDTFDHAGAFDAAKEAEYALRCEEFLTLWLPHNRKVIDEFYGIASKVRVDMEREHYGARAVYEIMRFHTMTREDSSDFKLNNNYVSLVARFIMAKFPQFDGFFKTRKISDLPEARAKLIFEAAMRRAGMAHPTQAELF